MGDTCLLPCSELRELSYQLHGQLKGSVTHCESVLISFCLEIMGWIATSLWGGDGVPLGMEVAKNRRIQDTAGLGHESAKGAVGNHDRGSP